MDRTLWIKTDGRDCTSSNPISRLKNWYKRDQGIRQLYNDSIKNIDNTIKEMRLDGAPLEEQARAAYEIRHHARLSTREFMKHQEVRRLEARDRARYPNGMTFDAFVERAKINKGLSGDEIYEDIINSSQSPNKLVNIFFGVK